MNLMPGNFYTRKGIWNEFYPDRPYPNGGPWVTGYTTERNYLIAFANINSPGRTGHDFPNKIDDSFEKMTWFGKPNAHSEQATFRSLFRGQSRLLMFVRWDNKCTLFTFLGSPSIIKYENDIKLNNGITTIQIELLLEANFDQNQTESLGLEYIEGKKIIRQNATYERNPRLRAECIRIHGTSCKICDFNFQMVYGDLGANYCHVHHITPLSEMGKAHLVNPEEDLMPVCPNCHAMLHKRNPAIKPEELRALITKKSALV